MRILMMWSIVFALAMVSGAALHAQDISGDWQGTLKAGAGLRIILHVAKCDDGWNAMFYSIDQGTEGVTVSSVSWEGSEFKFAIGQIHGSYEGKLSADGALITGVWTQNGAHTPLDFRRATKETAWQRDSSPHTISFVAVDKDVKLEVLDWGGSGRPLIFLAGLGNTAHVFDTFALKFTPAYHVYGITRRGFGASSVPIPANGNYSADRLGDDVLVVIDSLKLNRPVLVGHSIAGEELSSIGSRHPEKVAGLIYLDAGYWYAFYDRSRGNVTIDSNELRKKLEQLPLLGPPDAARLIQELLQTGVPQLEKDLQENQKGLAATPPEMQVSLDPSNIPIATAPIIAGEQEYTDIRVPILAIFADPHDLGPKVDGDPLARAKWEAYDTLNTGAQADAFEKGLPSAHVVRLPRASHTVFLSNEEDVLREMNAFLAKLK